jgi:hypothetical protein
MLYNDRIFWRKAPKNTVLKYFSSGGEEVGMRYSTQRSILLESG